MDLKNRLTVQSVVHVVEPLAVFGLWAEENDLGVHTGLYGMAWGPIEEFTCGDGLFAAIRISGGHFSFDSDVWLSSRCVGE